MSDILEELAGMRRQDAAMRESEVPFDLMLRWALRAPEVRDFVAAFRGGDASIKPRIIAELKRASPSEGMIREKFHPVELARELEAAGATALSVLCEPHRFLGDEDYLREVRAAVSLPILYKDFITTRYQLTAARAAGADAALLIAAVLNDAALKDLIAFAHELGLAALVETHDEREIARAVECGARMVGVNCRNLRNFSTDVTLLESLVGKIPRPCLRIAESGMHTSEAVRRAQSAGADGFLVGTALMRAARPGKKLEELTTTRKGKRQ